MSRIMQSIPGAKRSGRGCLSRIQRSLQGSELSCCRWIPQEQLRTDECGRPPCYGLHFLA